MTLKAFLLALTLSSSAAFTPTQPQSTPYQTSLQATSRRNALQLLSTLPILTSTSSAQAKSDLFKPNPLANPILEQIRIWEQDEADNIIYKGELASGTSYPGALETYVQLLLPILQVERNVLSLYELSKNNDLESLKKMGEILSQPNLEKKAFKKAFNAFADNIYYTDTDRANVYLGGGATPGSTQSLAYLLRNDVLTNIEDMRAEVAYLIKESEKGGKIGDGGLELDDLVGMVKMAKEGMEKYLNLVPPKELELARAKFG